MRFNYIFFSLIGLIVLYSCDDKETQTIEEKESSRDAQIYYFTASAKHTRSKDTIKLKQDSLKFLAFNSTNYAIDQYEGKIYNSDSLPYGITLKKAKIELTFNSTYGVQRVDIGKTNSDEDYEEWNTSDSIDISSMPIYFRVVANAGNSKVYELNMNIHQVDPEAINWEDMGRLPQVPEKQKVLFVNDVFYSFSVLGNNIHLNTSSPGILSWSSTTLTGLPNNVLIESLSYLDDKFLLITESGNSYISTDGINWLYQQNAENIKSLYGVLPVTAGESLVVLGVEQNGKYYFATTKDFSEINIITDIAGYNSSTIPERFPVSGFATLSSYRENNSYDFLVIVAGEDRVGEELNTTWLVQKTSAGLAISSSGKNTYFKGAGLSAFLYDNGIYVLDKNKFYISSSWGETWIPASEKQNPDSEIEERQYQEVAVDNENYIWIFGGVSESQRRLNDIWKGRLNGLNVN